MHAKLAITAVPPGEAPLWVREQWVGLVLPLAQPHDRPLLCLASGVLSGPRSFLAWIPALLRGRMSVQVGYRVDARAAVDLLAAKSPPAAAWWRESAPHRLDPGRWFLFPRTICEVVKSDA